MAVLAFLCLLAGMARAVAADDGFSAFDDVPAAPAEPTVPAAAVEGARRGLRSDCADSASWYYNDDPDKTCEAYVSKKSKNCKKKDEVSGTFYGSGGECAGTYERKLNRDGYPKVCDDYTNIPVYKCQDCESSCTIHYSDDEGFWYVGGSGCSSDSGVMRAFTDYPSDPSRVDTYGWNEWRSDWGQYGGNVDIRVTCDEWPED